MHGHPLYKPFLLLAVWLLSYHSFAQVNTISVTEQPGISSFPIISNNTVASLYYDKKDATVVGIAANAFKKDIAAITGKQINIINDKSRLPATSIIVGTLGHCEQLDQLVSEGRIDVSNIKGKWETFAISTIDNKGKKWLLIAGSDRRGTAYGLFHLSRMMGVSPFVWWADVVPAKRKQLYVSGSYTSPGPSVKYRGLFINDEDWGLQPWAAKNQDPLLKDIGPNTYAKVFELMLRLKANYIWPAMHPCTKAFYYYKDNPKVADQYAIIVGGSHCEPMLRNNVFEWAENFEHEYGKKPGEWRYDLNKNQIYNYWQDRVKEAASYESIYTVGMRGIHDGSMPGPRDPNEKLKLLEQVIIDQRKILNDNLTKPATDVPQIFVPYKEVLSLYQRGLPLDDDITIIWPDDNHGYIRQLPSDAERRRSGGHGVYYHLSYWGSPHDYLWLSSISPALIGYEMNKAYYHGADRLWVFNVGDIKPAELELQFAMDMAWDIHRYPPTKASDYIKEWATEIFGEKNATAITEIKKEYYELAQTAKPEHLGLAALDIYKGQSRLERYRLLAEKTNKLQSSIPMHLHDAWYELIEYPVYGAYLMNKKIVYQQKCRLSVLRFEEEAAIKHRQQAVQAFDSIKLLTEKYNTGIARGKWNGIMSWKPRDLAIFNPPVSIDSFKKARESIPVTTKPPRELDVISSIYPTDYKTIKQTDSLRIEHIDGLGQNITVLPSNLSQWSKITSIDSVYTTYKIRLQPGSYVFRVKCLPLFATGMDKKLQYTLIVNDRAYTVNMHSEAESPVWKQNVARGYSAAEVNYDLHEESTVTLKLYMQSPSIIFSGIEICEYR